MSESELLSTVEIETGPGPAHAILWLHGLGADGNDFVPIINELTVSSKKPIRFIFPHAPERPVTINGGYVMRAWYDIYGANIGASEDETGIRTSQKAIDALIENELRRGIASTRIVLAGFSQGGAMALQAGLRQQSKLGGIMALSCYLPLSASLHHEAQPANTATPIFMAHGTHDAIVPITLAISSKEKLLRAHYAVEWHEYSIEHSVCSQEIDDIDQWLQQIIF
ncbi:MAG: dienelactone hydrolase family protein [Nitrosomonas sp.]|nr:dienelactone hydrolase family protein [Nitrosomonas sp.]